MNFLITNDDGIRSGGIARLSKVLSKHGKVFVVAPDSQRSGASQSITTKSPLILRKVSDFSVPEVEAYEINGTPADCVRLGLKVLPLKPDYVFSGINFGYNCGGDLMYSGTFGAANEGAFQGIPSVALSEGTGDGFKITDKYLDGILEKVFRTDIKSGQILNINFPTCSEEDFKGILEDRIVSKRRMFEDSFLAVSEENAERIFSVKSVFNSDCENDSDIKALLDNYISLSLISRNF